MTLLVRDAADLIEANLRYHRAQGVDLFVIGDNGSTDGIARDPRAVPARRAGRGSSASGGSARQVQAEGRTKLARMACELGADWVIHNDQDEFWWPLTGDLKQALAAIPERFGLVLGAAHRVRRPAGRGLLRRAPHRSRGPLPAPAEDRPPHPSPGEDLRSPTRSTSGSTTAARPAHGLVGRPVRRARGRALRGERARAAPGADVSRSASFTSRFAPSSSTRAWSKSRSPTATEPRRGGAQGARRLPRRAASRRSTGEMALDDDAVAAGSRRAG